MTVCQFFLQGRCRFGQNCRFEHAYSNDDKNSRSPVNSQQPSYKQIVAEVILAEKGNQWPLSCFCPVKGGSNILGLEDISPEEVRWKMYEARTNGTLAQCKQEINQLYGNAEKIRNLIKDSRMERVIVDALKDKTEQASNSSGKFTSLPSSTSIFGSSQQFGAVQNIFNGAAPSTGSHGSIFGGSPPSSGNIFGGSNEQTGNIFGGSAGFSSQNIFGSSSSSSSFSSVQNSNQNLLSNSSTGSGSIFSNASISNKNIFSKVGENTNQNSATGFLSTNSSNVFQNQPSSGPVFGPSNTFFQSGESKNQTQPSIFGSSQNENIFKTQNNFSKANSVFITPQEPRKTGGSGAGTNQNPFSATQQMTEMFDSSLYSKIDDLNEEEIKCFSSATFTFGKIPLKPPPMEYCK